MKNKRHLLSLVMVITLGSFISIYFYFKIDAEHAKVVTTEFEKIVDARAASLYRELSLNFEALSSLAILFSHAHIPNYMEFQYQAQKILERYNNIQALEWIPKINKDNLEEQITNIKKHFPDYMIKERINGKLVATSSKETYFPVFYVEPYIGNEKALGFDLSSSPKRLKTLNESQLSTMPLATSSINLIQEKAKQKGFLVFLPLYTDKNKTSLLGFVLAVYRTGDIFNHSAYNLEQTTISLTMSDNTETPEILASNVIDSNLTIYKKLKYQKKLPEIWGRTWSITGYPTNVFLKSKASYISIIALLTGLFITISLSIYVIFTYKRHTNIREKVQEKTLDLMEAKTETHHFQQQLIESNKMASLGSMSSGLAHELSQPLGAVLLKIELLSKMLEKQMHDKIPKTLEEMQSQTL